MEKNLTDRLFNALESVQEFKNLSMDAQAELILETESKVRILETFPKAGEGITFVCQECFRSSKQVPVCGDCNDESFICKYCGAETTYHEDGSSSCRSKEDVGKYQIMVVCSECRVFIDFKETELPEMDGMESHSLCESCGEKALAALK